MSRAELRAYLAWTRAAGPFWQYVAAMPFLVHTSRHRAPLPLDAARTAIERSILPFFDSARGRVEKEIVMGRGDSARIYHESVRVYLRAELEAIHREGGLTVLRAFGDFDGSPFDARRSPRLILLAEAPGGSRR